MYVLCALKQRREVLACASTTIAGSGLHVDSNFCTSRAKSPQNCCVSDSRRHTPFVSVPRSDSHSSAWKKKLHRLPESLLHNSTHMVKRGVGPKPFSTLLAQRRPRVSHSTILPRAEYRCLCIELTRKQFNCNLIFIQAQFPKSTCPHTRRQCVIHGPKGPRLVLVLFSITHPFSRCVTHLIHM